MLNDMMMTYQVLVPCKVIAVGNAGYSGGLSLMPGQILSVTYNEIIMFKAGSSHPGEFRRLLCGGYIEPFGPCAKLFPNRESCFGK